MRIKGDALGQGGDGAEVGGDVFADLAVATGGTTGEAAVFVGEDDGQAVYFGFDDVVEGLGFVVEQFAVAGLPCPDFGGVEGVAQAENGDRVNDFGEFFGDGAARPLGGGIGGDEFGVGGFELDELLVEGVVFGVADEGGIEDVVAVEVVVELVAEGLEVGGHGVVILCRQMINVDHLNHTLCAQFVPTPTVLSF